MWLLERDNTGQFRLTKHAIPDIPLYAILSHTWGDEEVLFKDLKDGTAKNKAGYAKIQFCGDQAWRDGLKYFWVDTCCIDKSDAAELQHSLNSMFQWYRNAAKCYVYLTDVSSVKRDANGNSKWELAFQRCRWFTRGWTLQELIAPMIVEFFSKEGAYLGDKQSLGQHICNATGLPLGALQSNALSDFSIEERMSWVKNRTTTRKEDKAYSLFGIFDVCMPILYGEGEDRAFKRLREEISKDDRYLANLHSTDPSLDKQRIEEAKGGLLVDAYRWILDSSEFRLWHDRPESRLLWIKGDPGKGKTMLLCGIVNELERALIADGYNRNLAYFFCQATDTRINNATAVLRGLIYLLARQQPRLLSYIRRYIDAGKSLSDTNAWVAASNVLGEMLEDPNLKVTYLVIDALDECVIDQQNLLGLIVRISSVSARIKLVISSRNWVHIEEQLATVAQESRLSLELNAESVTAAVEAFIQHKVLYLSGLKHYDNTMEDAVHHYLSSNADGTFLWVALVCQALADSNVRRWQTLNKLRAFPPGLDSLYARMMIYINKSDDSDLCKRILATTTVVRRPISLCELVTIVKMPDDISENPEYLEELIKLCGSFLVLRERVVYFVHQSAKDFLQGKAAHQASREAFNRIFPQGIEIVNRTVSLRSLKAMSTVLKRDMYGLSAPGFPIDQVRVPDPDPLATVRYSCIYWVGHLSDSVSGTNANPDTFLQDDGAVYTFLKTKYLYWLEALSLLGAMSEGVIAVGQLSGILDHINQKQLPTVARDAHRFALSNRLIVEQAPLQAYTSALVFAPISSLVRQNYKTEKPNWISTEPVVELQWNACLQTLEGHYDWVRSVAFSPDGQQLASGSDDKTIKIWDPTSGQCLQTLEGHYDWVRSVAFSPDGQQLVSGSVDKTIKIWDPASGQCLQTLEGHYYSVQSIAFSPNGQQLASGSDDRTIRIWDPTSGQCLQTLEGHHDSVRSIAFSPNGQQLASGSDDKTIKIWDPTSGQCLQTLTVGHHDWVQSIAFSPNGQQLASGSFDKTIKIWDPTSGQCLQTLEGHHYSIRSIAFSPNGQQLASGSANETIKIWDPTSGQCLQTLTVGHLYSVQSIAFSPNGQQLASGSANKTIKIWDPASGQCLQTLEGHHNWVQSIAFSPNGQQLASGSVDKTIKIWDPTSGQCLQTLVGHHDWVRSVAFSPNSQQLASGSDDKTIKIWDPTSGQCLHTRNINTSVTHISFNHTGRYLITNAERIDITIAIPERLTESGNLVKHEYSLEQDMSWIACNGKNLLWLPPEYRPSCFTVQGRMISVGCSSGRVFTIGFSRDV